MSGSYKELIFWIYKQNPRIKLMVFYFPILIIIGFLFVTVGWNNVYENIVQEDSLVENAQFFAYAGASFNTFHLRWITLPEKGPFTERFYLAHICGSSDVCKSGRN